MILDTSEFQNNLLPKSGALLSKNFVSDAEGQGKTGM